MPGKCVSDNAIVDNAGTSIAIIECLPCKTGAGENNGYVIGYGSGDAWSDSAVEVYLTPLNPLEIEGELYLCRLEKDATHNTYLPGIAGYLLVVTPTTDQLCAHLHWSGDRAATDYEDYVESTVALPQIPQMSEFTRVSNVEKGSIYYDIINLEKGVFKKNIQNINFCDLSWSFVPGNEYVYNSFSARLLYEGKVSFMTSKYTQVAYDKDVNGTIDRTSFSNEGYIRIVDSAYSSVQEFIAAKGNEKLYYYDADKVEEYPIVTKSAPNYIGCDYGVEQFSSSKVPLAANILFYMRSLVSETRNFLDRLMAGLGSDVTAVADKIIAAVNSLSTPTEVNDRQEPQMGT